MKTIILAAALLVSAPCWACTDPPANAACAKYAALTAYRKTYGQQATSLLDARAQIESSDFGRRAEKIYYDACVADHETTPRQ